MIILIVFITLICLVKFRYIEINVILKQHIELKLLIISNDKYNENYNEFKSEN